MEGKSFLSPTEKRLDPIRRFGSPQRSMTHNSLSPPNSPVPLRVPEGHVAFRILCPGNRIGAVIGKSGSVINKIRKSTKSSIKVMDAPLGSPDGVITVIAEAGSTSRVKLGVDFVEEEEEVEVSKAQDALLRIFEVVHDDVRYDYVSCKLLMEERHEEAVRFEDSELLTRIREEIRCDITIGRYRMPVFADRYDLLVLMEGYFFAVKRALVSLSGRLQACQQNCASRIVRYKSLETDLQENFQRRRETEVFPRGALHSYTEAVPREASYGSSDVFQGDLSQQHRYLRDSLDKHNEIGQNDALDRPLESFSRDAYQRRVDTTTHEILSGTDFPSRRGSALDKQPYSITASGSKNHHVTIKQPLSESEDDGPKMVIKILCPSESAGRLIGPVGTNIKTLLSETGASIDVGDTYTNCDEFLITITSGLPDGGPSPAQIAIALVFSRLFEISTKQILDSGSRSFITARLVIPTNWIGCLLLSSQVWREIGASILVLDVGENPKFISANEQILQISGEFPTVKKAIHHATRIILCGPLRNSRKNSAAKYITTYIHLPGLNSCGEETNNPGSMGFHSFSNHSPTMSTSLPRRSEDSFRRRSHNPVNYSKPLDVDPRIRPEDRFSNRFSLTTEVDDVDSLRASPPPAASRGAYDGSGGLSSTGPDYGLGSGPFIVTGVTVDIGVSESAANSLCGEDDGYKRLQDLRQISGARVSVHPPQPGMDSGRITISGTPVYQIKPK